VVKAHLIAVGSELFLPGHEDSNTVHLRRRLFEMGIPVVGVSVAGDDEGALVRLLEALPRGANVIILTGGLGPTEDDVTKKAVARCLRKSMRYDDKVQAQLEQFFAARKRKMPENCLRQALIPVGARVLDNPVGTAPGILIEERGCLYFLLPGPPREMEPMFETQVAPLLRQKFGERRIVQRQFRLTGIPESAADQIAAPIYRRYADVAATILSKPGDIQLILTAADDPAGGAASLERLAGELAKVLQEYVYSTDGEPLEVVVGRLLAERRMRLIVAESCTGGMLAQRLTDVPGSSAYFLGGVVCYDNALKQELAGVPAEILERHGAVSSTAASALAAGIRRRAAAADISVAITGIAGPGGATPDKPVGLVYIGLSYADKLAVKKFQFYGDRERIRFQATQMAMELVRRVLLSRPVGD
jgi:nicotinamide-nucleotide amidase